MATERLPIASVTSIPASLGTTYTEIRLGNSVDIRIKVSGGSGNGQLLVWTPEASGGTGAWYPYGYPDTTMVLDSTKLNGLASFRYVVEKDAYNKYLLYIPAGITVSDATIKGIEV